MPSPRTTTDVVGVTGSAFGSALRGGGARELSTGAACSEGPSLDRSPPPKKPPKKPPPPPPDRGRCRLRNGKRSSRNWASAGDVSVTSTAIIPARSAAARRSAPAKQRDNRFFPIIPIAPMALATHGPIAPKKCQLKRWPRQHP